ELPRGKSGWSKWYQGSWVVLSHQPESQWRGTGLLFCKDEWSVLRKRPAGKGTWFKLRRLKDSSEIWVGTYHFTPGCTVDCFASQVDLFVSQAPKEPDRLVVQGDANAGFGWTETSGQWEAVGKDAKALILLDRFARQEGRQGRQIDTVGARRLRTEGVTIFRDSYLTLGTDHELLCSSFRIVQGKGVTRFQTKPRVWTGGPPTLEYVDQTVLENLAAKCTRPQPSHAYRDPQAVKDLFRAAKSSKTRDAWKTALASRKAARQQWERQRESRALQGDWKAFQQSKVQAKQGWEIDFADRQSRDPHDVVHDHLSGIYKGQGGDIQPVYDTSQEVTAFTVEELQTALGQLKGSKSVGRDLTSKELLLGIVHTDGGQQHLLEFMNRTLATQSIPAEWNRMVLNRVKHSMPYVSHAQCAGGQRQPSDVIFAIWRLLQLEREWKAGVVIAQIDIRKAFDTLCRRSLLQKLRAVLGNTPEYRCLHNLLCGTEATLQTDSLFMDDGLLWGRDVASLAARLREFSDTLSEYGLKLNHSKCKLYCSPFSGPVRAMQLGQSILHDRGSITVLGLEMRVGMTACQFLQPLITRARGKFWGIKHLLRRHTPASGRARLMDRVVTSSLMWCLGAIPPDKPALGLVNSTQYMLMGWMLRHGKRGPESWPDFRRRSVRASRAVMCKSGIKRWSTIWLERWWGYSGHRERASLYPQPPISTRIDHLRTLQWWEAQQA
ncbi:unnamed protein product, partial [Symbiodinium necroappetens]